MAKDQQVRITKFSEPAPFELYLPEASGPLPLICLTPILGRLVGLEDLFFERCFARFFACRGFATALIDRPIFEFDASRGIEQIQEYLDNSISRNTKVLDSLLLEKWIDPKRVGSFGTSFGAIVNSLWAAKDSRLKVHIFSLGGGNLPEIIATSRDPLMRSYVKAIFKSKTFNRASTNHDDFKEMLRNSLRVDPLEAASSISKENVLLFLALFDHVIHLRFGLAFKKALGNPKTVFLPLGHYTTILAIPFLKREALKFFQKKL